MIDPGRLRQSAPALAAMAFLAGCVAPGVPSGSATVDAGFTRSAGIFSTGTTIDVALQPRESDGRLAVCGAWGPRHITGQTRRLVDDAAATGVVQVDGQTVLMNLSQFPKVADGGRLDGATARCLVTGTDWQPAFASAKARARFAPQRYDVDPYENDDGVRFRTAY